MAALDQILAILTGRKVYDSTTKLWRIYDQYGTELADPGGILLRGLHGWLIQQTNLPKDNLFWYDLRKHVFYLNLDDFKRIGNLDLYCNDNSEIIKKLNNNYVFTL